MEESAYCLCRYQRDFMSFSDCAQQTEHCCKTKTSGVLAWCRDQQPTMTLLQILLFWFENGGGWYEQWEEGLGMRPVAEGKPKQGREKVKHWQNCSDLKWGLFETNVSPEL